MKRWLVIFSSHPAPPSDATVVDVRAPHELGAIQSARKSVAIQHPWAMVSAIPWPRGCPGVDEAAARFAAR